MAYLRIANLKKTYQASRTEKQEVLKGLNVEFRRGEFVAVLGESGCGKSTFINIVGGLDFDYTGSVVFDGFFIRDFTEKQLDDYRKKKIGFIFQNYNLIKHMTVLENVMIAMTMSSVSAAERTARANELLKQVGIEDQANKLPNQLSGGQKQRVAIARALANDPEIILADEPTGSLDKESAEAVLQILIDIASSGKLVICVTHSQKVASNCSRIIRMDDGIVAEDTKLRDAHSDIPRPKVFKPRSIGFTELMKLAAKNLLQNRSRSILVAIGMSIGIAAVVFMYCLSSGVKNYVTADTSTAMNKLQIDVAKDVNAVATFTSSDLTAINALDGVDYISKSATLSLNTQYKKSGENDSKYTTLLTLSTLYDGFEPTMVSGTLPESGGILISQAMATKLGAVNGQTELTLKVNGNTQNFTVIGVYTLNSSYDTAFLIYDDLTAVYGSSVSYNKAYVFTTDIKSIEGVLSDLSTLGFTAYRQDSAVEDLLEYVDIGTAVLTAVAAISLFISAIMIFIVLYISVVERTKEIGVLRAVGARRKDIRKLFVFEAGILGLAAGALGCALSFLVGMVTNTTLSSTYASGFVDNNILFYLIAIVAGVAISIVSGLSPAAMAANSNPVECLRYE